MTDTLVDAVLAEIGRAARMQLALIERFEAGENQATYQVEAGSERLVLKLDAPERLVAHERAARACRHLEARGYPVPGVLLTGEAAGCAYTLRTCLRGAPMPPEDGRFADRLIALVELQAGGAATLDLAPEDWPGFVVDPVLEGGAGYCLLETMRAHSDETAQLLQRLQGLVEAGRSAMPEAADILHFDFNPANILVDAATVTGVVDWEGVRAGDRAFDLATLLFYQYEAEAARAALWARLRALRSTRVIAVYLAHVILRQVEWSLRLHAPQIGRRYLDQAHRLLADMAVAGV